jgi:Mrp family chromosome partitioning ATPase
MVEKEQARAPRTDRKLERRLAHAASPTPVGSTRQSDGGELLESTSPKVVEALRYLVAREQLGDQSSFPARLAVVSAMKGEGVTTVSQTLASMIAHDLEAKVCWVDLNFASDESSAASGERHPRLVDVLTQRCRLEAALEATPNERLTFLRAGSAPRSRRPVLARSTMLDEVFEELDHLFQYVVLDIPAVLTSSESLALLRHARAYLMVVKHGSTTIPQVRSTAEELRTIPSLGVVLNQFEPHMPKRLQRLFAL